MVFRRIYGSEIEKVNMAEIEGDFKRQLDTARQPAHLETDRESI